MDFVRPPDTSKQLAAGFSYNKTHNFLFGQDVSTAQLKPGTQFFSMSGNVPCCIDASLPAVNSSYPGGSIGKVVGICAPSSGQANITWLGTTYAQDLSKAALLTMRIYKKPGKPQIAGPSPLAPAIEVQLMTLTDSIIAYFGEFPKRNLLMSA